MEELAKLLTDIRDLLVMDRAEILDAEGAARMLSLSKSTFLQRVACRPDFPIPSALTTSDEPCPRWIRAEIQLTG